MKFHRRRFLATSAAAGLGAALPSTVPAQAQTLAPGALMRARAETFLSLLDAGQRRAVLFDFATEARLGWNFMLGSRRAPGLALEQMTPPQKDAALDLLASGTSAGGLRKAMNIMLQQDILRDEWRKGSADRNRERFSLQVYGTPAPEGAWAWRWEGHHLSLTFTLLDDAVISTTPSSFSSEPNTVPSGPHEGLVVLKEEEVLARRLFTDLTGAARRAALVWPRSPGNIRSTFGAEGRVASEQAGLALGDMAAVQAELALRLVEVYTTEALPPELAAAQAARFAEEDPMALRFAWGGADMTGSVYYRLTGRHVLIEFASLVNQPLHLHAVFHDIDRNFGAHRTA